jgi:hypothetical protein
MRGLNIQSKSRTGRSCRNALMKDLELPPLTIRELRVAAFLSWSWSWSCMVDEWQTLQLCPHTLRVKLRAAERDEVEPRVIAATSRAQPVDGKQERDEVRVRVRERCP